VCATLQMTNYATLWYNCEIAVAEIDQNFQVNIPRAGK